MEDDARENPAGTTWGAMKSISAFAVALPCLATLMPACLLAVTFTEYTAPTANSNPYVITSGFGNLWFTEYGGNKIGKLTTTGSFTEYTVPTASSGASGITSGPD